MSSVNQGHPRLSFSPSWENEFQILGKRACDVAVSFVLLLTLSPLFLLLAILIKISSPGPVFYVWRVVGKHGCPFIGYKFRSMVVNADILKSDLESSNEMTGPMFKLTNDPRVTRIGSWMRRYSLDELPQLFGVLVGDMSLVGPRPPLATEYERFTEYQKNKLAVKPGLTCLWQVSGRNNVKDFDEWVRLDLEYIREWSLWLDFKIAMRTVVAIFAGTGK